MRKTTPLSTTIESAQVWANYDQCTRIVWQNDEGSYWCSRQGASAPSGRGCWRVVCRVHPEPAKQPSEYAELIAKARGQAEAITTCPDNDKLLRTLADLVESYAKSESEAVAACKAADSCITEFVDAEKPTTTDWITLLAARHLCRRAHENAPKGGGA